MTQNSIPALKAMASLQQAASSDYQAVTTGHGIKVAHAKTSVSFTVVSANPNQLMLQDNANKQRFSLPVSALSTNVSPKTGDTLVLVNANERQLSFRLISGAQSASALSNQRTMQEQGSIATRNQALPIAYNRLLVESWPGINLSVVAKVPLNVAAQSTLDANDPSIALLSKILTQNAVKLGQPLIELPLIGRISNIGPAGQAGVVAQVTVALGKVGGKDINIALPLPTRLASTLKAGSNLELLISPNRTNMAITAITTQNAGSFSNAELQAVNKANPQFNSKIQQLSEGLLFKAAQLNPASKSAAAQVFVQDLQKNVLNALPKSLSAQIQSSLPPEQIKDARLLISAEKQMAAGAKTSQSSGQINLMVIPKPQMLQIATNSIDVQSASRMLGSDVSNASLTNTLTSSRQTLGINEAAGTNVPPQVAAKFDVKNVNGILLEQLKQSMPANEISMLSPKIKHALNHTLSHSEPSAPVMNNLKTILDSIGNSASKETRALLNPLVLQTLQYIKTLDANPSTENSIGSLAKSINGLPQAPGETDLSDIDIPEMLRASMSTAAVTQITQNSQGTVQNSFIEGLVSLLKLSLAAKLSTNANLQGASKSAELAPNIAAFTNRIIKQNNPKSERINVSRVLQDIALSDPRGGLISEIGKLLSSHNAQKLRSAEASLQGQDTFYYSLPNMLNKNAEDIEIVIKREKQPQSNNPNTPSGSEWKLDIKLDAGIYGKVLAKTKFTTQTENQGIDLHLYASSESLKVRVLKYLPLLHQRLKALGINISSQKCDVGKVDATLFKTQLNVMHTYA